MLSPIQETVDIFVAKQYLEVSSFTFGDLAQNKFPDIDGLANQIQTQGLKVLSEGLYTSQEFIGFDG